MITCPPPFKFLLRMQSKGYRVFSGNRRRINLNIVGWRSAEHLRNSFNDILAVYWEEDNKVWNYKYWRVTTLPGIPWLLNPPSKSGTAILVPGQYLGVYRLGEYHGYTALKQVLPVKVYRDDSLDSRIDINSDKIEEGIFGIHIHRAGVFSRVVGVSSAGCQVFQRWKDYDEFLYYCRRSATDYGNHFSYTLLDEVDGNY